MNHSISLPSFSYDSLGMLHLQTGRIFHEGAKAIFRCSWSNPGHQADLCSWAVWCSGEGSHLQLGKWSNSVRTSPMKGITPLACSEEAASGLRTRPTTSYFSVRS